MVSQPACRRARRPRAPSVHIPVSSAATPGRGQCAARLSKNTFTDGALDGQYQFITDDHTFSLAATWIHEARKFDNITLAANRHNTLDTERVTASYFFRRRFGGSVQGFSTTGTRDEILYAAGTPVLGSAKGRPDTQGAILEIDFLPWLNTKLGAQYTMYGKFNGGTRNYDGFGRNARDNNTLLFIAWFAF